MNKVTSNGTLLNDEILNFFVSNDFKLSISLDGNQSHNEFRKFKNGRESFSLVIQNINYIKKEFPAYFERNVFFLSVLHKKNSVGEVDSFFESSFNKLASISMLSRAGLCIDKEEYFDQNLYHDINLSNKSLDGTNLKLNYLTSFVKENFGFICNKTDCFTQKMLNCESYYKYCSCIPFKNEPFLKADGTIYRCTEIDNLPIGSVSDGSIKIDFDFLVEEFNSYTIRLNKLCQRCYNFLNCDFCVFYHTSNNKGSVLCEDFKNYSSCASMYKSFLEMMEESEGSLEHLVENIFLYEEFD